MPSARSTVVLHESFFRCRGSPHKCSPVSLFITHRGARVTHRSDASMEMGDMTPNTRQHPKTIRRGYSMYLTKAREEKQLRFLRSARRTRKAKCLLYTHCIVLYCIVCYCIVCIVLYRIVLHLYHDERIFLDWAHKHSYQSSRRKLRGM